MRAIAQQRAARLKYLRVKSAEDSQASRLPEPSGRGGTSGNLWLSLISTEPWKPEQHPSPQRCRGTHLGLGGERHCETHKVVNKAKKKKKNQTYDVEDNTSRNYTRAFHRTNCQPDDDQTGQNSVVLDAPIHCFTRYNGQFAKIQSISFLAIFWVRPKTAYMLWECPRLEKIRQKEWGLEHERGHGGDDLRAPWRPRHGAAWRRQVWLLTHRQMSPFMCNPLCFQWD